MKLLNRDLSKYTLRPEQSDAEEFIFNILNENSATKYFLLDMPTGVGKSVLTLSFIQRYLKEINPDVKFDVITESKMLQNQYAMEFDSISNLWGKNGYKCTQFDCSCEQGKDFAAAAKTECDACPYSSARTSFMHGTISLTNFHLFVLMHINGLLQERKDNKILIVDEAHELESVYSNFLTIEVNEKAINGYDLPNGKHVMNTLKKIKTPQDFYEYCEEYLLVVLANRQAELNTEFKQIDGAAITRQENADAITGNKSSLFIEASRKVKKLESFISKINYFMEEYDRDSGNWISQIVYDEKKNAKLVVQPIWSNKYMAQHIFSKYDKVIMMSGTILNKEMFSFLNGLNPNLVAYHRIDSPFEAKKRPIYYIPSGRMSMKTKEAAYKTYKPMIDKLLRKYPTKKGIIHTVTFELQNWVNENIKTDRLLLHTSDQSSKNFALKEHYTAPKPTVLVSPSMHTGIDLKNSRARFQICLKVPYPYLGDLKNKKRMESNKDWYNWVTVSKIIQMYGRAVRSTDDFADFIIIDACFTDILIRSEHLFPQWVLDAIKTVDNR